MLNMTEIKGRGAALVNALSKNGGWMTRAELAAATGKNQLSPNDINWLERLSRDGVIEVDQRTIPGPVGFEYIYRVSN